MAPGRVRVSAFGRLELGKEGMLNWLGMVWFCKVAITSTVLMDLYFPMEKLCLLLLKLLKRII